MTHYTTSYEGLTEVEKHNKAIEDIKEWMGEERFDHITSLVRDDVKEGREQMTLDQFTMAISLAGVQGYPVKAWYNYIYGL